MPRLVFLTKARRDLGEIASYIQAESQSADSAIAFTDRIIGYCERLATLPALMGRARPELRDGYRSVTLGSYVIFFRYMSEDANNRAVIEILHIVHGSRDLEAYFRDIPMEDAP